MADQVTKDAATDNKDAATDDKTLLTGDGDKDKSGEDGDKTILGGGDDKGKEGDKEDKDKAGAPEEYGDFALPEKTIFSESQLGKVKEVAKEFNLSQEAAQKLVDMSTGFAQEYIDAQTAAFTKLKSEWADQVKADKEIGGSSYKENIGVAIKAINKFGSDDLKKMLDDTGFGNHPAMIRCFFNIGKAISEDKLETGDAEKKPAASRFYEKSNHVI